MQIIISPAKKMVINQDDFLPTSQPRYLAQTKVILSTLLNLSYDHLQTLWHTSDKLTAEAYDILIHTDLRQPLTPAIFSYSGIQYQYMAPNVLSQEALDYLQNTLWILSGFYGALRPFDGIVPYRLELGTHLQIAGYKNLYDFWGDRLYQAVHGQGPIINLASKEYSRAITPYLQPDDQFIDVTFAYLIDGKLKVRATAAKMARGEMVRFIVENHLNTIEELKTFSSPDYIFDEAHSTASNLVFLHK